MTGDHRARGDGRPTADDPTAGDGRDRRRYDRWSDHGMLYGSVVRLVAPMRRRALEALAAAPGERVLDLACGPGPGPAPDFGPLRDAVGPAGEAVGLDYGEGVVRRDRERVDEGGRENVDVVRADAREEFDPGAGYLAVARRAGRGV